MRKSAVLFTLAMMLCGHPAMADLGRWSTVIEKDPFSGKQTAIAEYEYTDASLSIACSRSGQSLVTIISPFNILPTDTGRVAELSLALNEEVALSARGTMGEFSHGRVGSTHPVSFDAAIGFLKALAGAKGDIAVKSNIFAKIVYFPSTGSTIAAKKALAVCSVD